MPFIVFDHKDARSFDIPAEARAEMIARIDRDYPPYVTNIPSIYDTVSRQCFNGVDECTKYLSTIGRVDTPPEPSLDTPAEPSTEEHIIPPAKVPTSGPVETPAEPEETVAASSSTVATDISEPSEAQHIAEEVPEPPKKKTTRRKKVTVVTP